MAIAPSSMPMTRCDRFSTEAKCLSGFSLTMQRTEPPLIKLARHATGVIGVIGGAIGARRARRGEVSQRWDPLGPVAPACLPQVRADKCLRAMLEGLFDRNHDHRRGLLAIDSKTPLQDRIDANPGLTVDPICFVRPGDQ